MAPAHCPLRGRCLPRKLKPVPAAWYDRIGRAAIRAFYQITGVQRLMPTLSLSEGNHHGPLVVISFDIDGTLEVGDPSGAIPMAFVRDLMSLAHHRIGSCSDNTTSWQQRMWDAHDIEPHFTVVKHRLHEVRASYEAHRYVHIGDRSSDREAAHLGGFEFVDVRTLVDEDGVFQEHLLLHRVLALPR